MNLKRIRRRPFVPGSFVALSLSTAAFAQPAPGTDFQLNDYTSSVQHSAFVIPAPGGRFVAVWDSYLQDGSRAGVFGRRFDRMGAPLGPEFPVNAYTTEGQSARAVHSDAKGNFVVIWETLGTGERNIVGRRFDRTGAPLTPEFVVSAHPSSSSPSIARGRDGRFLVAWGGFEGVYGIRARWFDATATPVGAEFWLKPDVGRGAVVSRPQGGFLAYWTRASAGIRLEGRIYDEDGNPLTGEFLLVESPNEQPRSAAVDESGAFVVVWGRGSDLDQDVYMRRFDASGQPLGTEFLVNADTTQFRWCRTVGFLADGSFLVTWTSGNVDFDVAARQFDASGTPMGPEFVLPAFSGYFQEAGALQPMRGGHLIATWSTDILDGSGTASYARLFGVVPMALAVDATAARSSGNGVLEPGEEVRVSPSWANGLRDPIEISGTLSDFSGPGPAAYTIVDAAADYGTVAVGDTGGCGGTGDCYTVAVSDPSVRPATHWDATIRERVLGGGALNWELHLGRSFHDVPASSGFYRFIETLLHDGVTTGCSATEYCPRDPVSRDQMAVFAVVGKEAEGYVPRACAAPMFVDVPASSPFCPFVEELARRGVVGGCGGGSYCPAQAVTREQMPVFVLRTLAPALDPPACMTPRFADVPASSPFCRWIEELARRGVVAGCGGGRYCPQDPVTREQMAAFVTVTFGLSLYGP